MFCVQPSMELRVGEVVRRATRPFVPHCHQVDAPVFPGDYTQGGRNAILVAQAAYADFIVSAEMEQLFCAPVYAFSPDPVSAWPWTPGIHLLEWDHYFVVNVSKMFYEAWATDNHLEPRLDATLEASICAHLIKLDWWMHYALTTYQYPAIQISTIF